MQAALHRIAYCRRGMDLIRLHLQFLSVVEVHSDRTCSLICYLSDVHHFTIQYIYNIYYMALNQHNTIYLGWSDRYILLWNYCHNLIYALITIELFYTYFIYSFAIEIYSGSFIRGLVIRKNNLFLLNNKTNKFAINPKNIGLIVFEVLLNGYKTLYLGCSAIHRYLCFVLD